MKYWMVKKLLKFIFLSLCCFDLAHAGRSLEICDDVAGWPPYTFIDSKNPQMVTGFSVDLIVEILRRSGYQPKITLLPWKRCLEQVENGKSALLLNASYNEERAQKFLISQSYYSVLTVLFYRREKLPEVAKTGKPDLKQQLRYCGLFGYDYQIYGFPESQLDQGARTQMALFAKLRLDRCDFVLGGVENIQRLSLMGQLDLDGISHIKIPGARSKEYHVMVSRKLPDSEHLLQIINDGITLSKKNGSYSVLRKKYGL